MNERLLDAETMGVSVVIPVHNEADNIAPLIDELARVFDDLNQPAEIIVVDDGSTDDTYQILHQRLSQLKGIYYRAILCQGNRGQTEALRTGITCCQYPIVVTMDGDRQNNPTDIPRLIAKLQEGFQLVCGWRARRQDRFWAKRLPSMLGNLLTLGLTKPPIRDTGCTLKAMTRELAQRLPLYSGMHRFIPALATLESARIAEIPVDHRPRPAGRSKYGFGRTGLVLADLAVLRLLGLRGHGPALFGIAFGLWLLLVWTHAGGGHDDSFRVFFPPSDPRALIGPSIVLSLGVLAWRYQRAIVAGMFAGWLRTWQGRRWINPALAGLALACIVADGFITWAMFQPGASPVFNPANCWVLILRTVLESIAIVPAGLLVGIYERLRSA